jgi:signal transduction histidine kinase
MGDDPWTLAARLRLLAERVELEWSVEVEVRWRDDEHAVPLGLVDDVYYIVSEAVVNAARHSGASFVGVDIATRNDHVRIVVLDDGKGFPFQGRYEGPELEREGWGPAVLRGRVFALAGQLEIESTSQGSSVEVTLPFPTVGAGRAHH